MPSIDPTSIIDPQARIAEDVQIGPYCIIRGPVRIGAGSRLIAHVYLKGPLVIGERNLLYPHVCIGMAPQTRRISPEDDQGGTAIGNNNIFREGVTIHRSTSATPTTVGNDNYMMACSHLGHDVQMGNDCTLANNALIAGHVQIGDRVTLGGNAAAHQFCRIGRLAILSGIAGIVQDLPPFCMVVDLRRVSGLNLVGLRRAGLQQHIDNLRQVFDIMYRQRHTNATAADLIEERFPEDPLCMEMVQFIRTTKRGITTYASSTDLDSMRRSENGTSDAASGETMPD